MVDVLDRDRAFVYAGAAGDAVPDHVLGHAVPGDRRELAAGEQVRPFGEHLVADPMITSFGDSDLPVAYAGQTSWQRPHSVQENESTISFHVRSAIVPAPNRISALGNVESQRLEPSAPTCAREEDIDRGRRDVQVLRVRQVAEEREDHGHVRPHEERSRTTRCRNHEMRDGVREERPVRGPLVQPGAMRDACQPSSVRTTTRS